MKLRLPILLGASLLLLHLVGEARQAAPLIIPKIQTPITCDGLLDDPPWKGISPFQLIVYAPNTGQEPSERTGILLAYDDDFVYAGARFYDREPEGIQATSKKRDDMKPSNDWFGIILDTFRDYENAVGLFTSPTGLRTDIEISNDAQGDASFNASWNTTL